MKKVSRCNYNGCSKRKYLSVEYCLFHYRKRNYAVLLKSQPTGCGGGKQTPKFNMDGQELG